MYMIENMTALRSELECQNLSESGEDGVTYPQHKVIRRNGSMVLFDPQKITLAVTKAFLALSNSQESNSARTRELIDQLTQNVICALLRSRPAGGNFHIEDIQDQVELALMRAGEHNVARAYVLYREKRARERIDQQISFSQQDFIPNVNNNGIIVPLDIDKLTCTIESSCAGFTDIVSSQLILDETLKNLYDGIHIDQVYDSAILASRTCIERDPIYSQVTARLLLHKIRYEVLGKEIEHQSISSYYVDYFPKFIKLGVDAELIDKRLLRFDLLRLANILDARRDLKFDYIGLKTLYDRYFLNIEGIRIELPQIFFMRIAMGLAIKEIDCDNRAIEFYNVLSSFDFMNSTPTLFNSGTCRPQLSSCYLTTVPDDLDGIYESLKDNALLSKFAGGLGNDWTRVRALGSYIKGTNGKSQGVVPFLKVVNDTAVAVNQGGKRKGAVCAYLETWHLDIEEFLDLRKNTGDDRRRTPDMNTANWIPDLFMKRVIENAEWTLFSPSDCPDLHDKFGRDFEEKYIYYEKQAINGNIKLFRKIPALQLWRKMLGMLFETGHPWITFKDPCNIRSSQRHIGIVHSSNLCTEITLNTSESEIAVCNLGSINLVSHLKLVDGQYNLDHEKLKRTIKTAMRMLDNVIDINYYAVSKAKKSNLTHRPVGLGIMGFQDCLHTLRVPYASENAVAFADLSMEAVCYYAYYASTELAEERGYYDSYRGSLWDQGILPQDSIDLLAKSRGGYLEVNRSSLMNWDALRKRIAQHGMRNSNCVAIAPTATISNIIGVSPCIEPTFQNIFVKSNLSGEFTIVNKYLVNDLKACGIWDDVMISDLKYFDGKISRIKRIPYALRALYETAFEIDAKWLIEAASRRQKWIDQSQSLNIYMSGISGKKLDEIYKFAWIRGLKTTYYLRSIAATHAEKSTVAHGSLNAVSASRLAKEDNSDNVCKDSENSNISVCIMHRSDPSFEECESCQ